MENLSTNQPSFTGVKLLDRYELTSQLDRGGMGVVYRARDLLLERETAVKLIRPDSLGPETEERFRREARLVAQMDHPAIVPIYDFGRHEDSLFLVMPLVEGFSLQRLIRERSLQLSESIEIVAQVANGLDYSHSLGVIHRDIKPANLMISRSYGELRARIMDFGLALGTKETRLTGSGILGTAAYMSPEQISGSTVDGRSDLYALGTVLYECLAGKPPFTGALHTIFYHIIHQPPESLRSRGVEVDAELDELVLQCLAKAPSERPPNCKALVRMLRSYEAGLSEQERLTKKFVLPLAEPDRTSAFTVHEDQNHYWNVPYPRNPFFTGREQVFQGLLRALAPEGAVVQGQIQVISGLGGIGKTQTAVEYAYRYRDFYNAVFWLKAETNAELKASFIRIADVLGLPEKGTRDQDQAVRAVRRWLEENRFWLLIVDNADQPELTVGLLPPNLRGQVLLTSRAQVFDVLGIAKPLGMSPLSPPESREFLLRRTGRDSANREEREAAEELAGELGYLPLALEQAGAYILARQVRFRDYLSGYRSRGLDLLTRAHPKSGDRSHPVATTWKLNFLEIERASRASADLLRASAFLGPDQIPLELLVKGAPELGSNIAAVLAEDSEEIPLMAAEVLEPLTRFSLVQRDIDNQTYSIHRLVQEVSRSRLDMPVQRLWVERIVRAMIRTLPDVEFSNWSSCDRLVSHAKSIAEYVEKLGLELEEAGHLMNTIGLYSIYCGQYSEAEPLIRQALALRDKVLAPGHPDIAESLTNLGAIHELRGRYAEAELMHQRALTIREKVLEANHPDIANSFNNLGVACYRQGRYLEAESMYQRALAIRERTFGPDHPNVAECLNNLAALYRAEGRLAEARPLIQRSLALWERVLGPNHPNVAFTLNNLAALHQEEGRFAEAKSLAQRSLALREQALGPDHPDVAKSLTRLAALLLAEGRYAEAEPIEQRSLAIRQENLGPNHPDVAESLYGLATLYHAQNRYTEAEPLYRRTLALWEKIWDRDHPRLASCLEAYGALLREMKRTSEAEEVEGRVERIHGAPDHPLDQP